MTLAAPRRRSRVAKDRDVEIQRVAIDLFLRKGIAETRVDEILEASGTSVGSFYYRFDSKIDLAATLYLEILESCYASLIKSVRQRTTARELVEGMIADYLDWAVRNPLEFAYEFYGRTPEVVRASQPRERIARETFFQSVMALLKPYVESGEIREMEPEHMFAVWLGPAEKMLQSVFARSGYELNACEANLRKTVASGKDFLCASAWASLAGPADRAAGRGSASEPAGR